MKHNYSTSTNTHYGLNQNKSSKISLWEACGCREAQIKKEYKDLGDLGLVAKASRSSQSLMRKPQTLTVKRRKRITTKLRIGLAEQTLLAAPCCLLQCKTFQSSFEYKFSFRRGHGHLKLRKSTLAEVPL